MIRLVAVRHAQSVWNAAGRWQGRADPPLSPTGEAQARRAGTALGADLAAGVAPGPIRSLWCSDLRRSRQTAALLAEAAGYGAATLQVPALGEHDVGEWSGLTQDEIEGRWPGQILAWSEGRLAATPGGEARAAFDARVREGFRQVVAAVRATPVADGLHLVVTHGGVLRAVARWLGAPERATRQLEGVVLGVGEDGRLGWEGPVTLLQGWCADIG